MPGQHFEKAGSLKLPEAHTSNEGTAHFKTRLKTRSSCLQHTNCEEHN